MSLQNTENKNSLSPPDSPASDDLDRALVEAAQEIEFDWPEFPRRFFWIDLPVGFAVLVLSLLAGEEIKIWLHLPIPANVLGLFVLLLCFRLRLIPPQLIEEAANRLLYVLPALFIPLFVSAIGRGQLWSKIGWVLLPTLLVATAGLWMFVGHFAQHLLRRSFQDE
jgi:holin-like protein